MTKDNSSDLVQSLYLHVPFCEKICSYCDFFKLLYHEEFVKAYLSALEEEIKEANLQQSMNTIYIGGGTPSVLKDADFERLLQLVKPYATLETEWTVECNPNDLTESKMDQMVKAGVNRLSLGIQTFDELILKQLNRSHTSRQAKEALELCQRYGINFSADLIYGLPHQTDERLHQDVDTLLTYHPHHISCYALQVEPHTLMGIQKVVQPLDDQLRAQYDWLVNYLRQEGYTRYETSNFALPGYESRHNQVYWRGLPYYGFGPGASGYVNQKRYSNTRKINDYLKGNRQREFYSLSLNEQEFEFFMLGLRLEKGISTDEYHDRFGRDFYQEYQQELEALLRENLLEINNHQVRVTDQGFYIFDYVLLRLTHHLEY